jgi:predicted acylesterase/phospholipase RssA
MEGLPETLVFCGGGTRCLVFAELLVLLEKGGQLGSVRDVYGTSAGSLIAALYAVTHSAVRVKSLLWELDFSSLRNVDVGVLFGILQTWGMDNGGALIAGIERLLLAAGGPSGPALALRDLPGLHIVVADITLRETCVLSAANFPDLRVAEAVRASMTFPIFFTPYRAPNGHLWVDGGVRANFPWNLLTAKDQRRALGFAFLRPVSEIPRNLSEYMLSMIHFDESKKRTEILSTPNILTVPTPPFPAWFLRLHTSDYELLSSLAHSAYTEWVARRAEISRISGGSGATDSRVVTTSLTNVRPAGLACPPGTNGSPPLSDLPCTRPPFSLPHHTAESSDSPPACPASSRGSSPHPPPRRSPISRRWSF